jgi:transposase-like protein
MDKDTTKTLNKVVQIDEGRIRDHLGELVRGTVEETLNGLLDAEANRLCNAPKYSRSPERIDTRAGHYTRKLHTRAGEVRLRMPKLRKTTFESAIIERYRRRESSVEEALIEMYLAGVSVRRVETITEALWGTRVSPATVSKLNKKIYRHIEDWRNRPIEGAYPYVYLDGMVLKRSWGGEVRNLSVLVAIGVGRDGFRKVLGVAEGAKEDKAGWSDFLRHLKARGLDGVQLVISDACLGWWNRSPSSIPRPSGSAASCIGIATSSPTCLRPGCARWHACSRPSTPRRTSRRRERRRMRLWGSCAP